MIAYQITPKTRRPQALKRGTAISVLIYSPSHGLFLQKQAGDQRSLPYWDLSARPLGSHESLKHVLADHVRLETGWTLKEVKGLVRCQEKPASKGKDQEWIDEYSFLVTIESEASAPRTADQSKGWQWVEREDLTNTRLSPKLRHMLDRAFQIIDA